MDISSYAASAEGIDALSRHQINEFFALHGPVTKDACHKMAETITGGRVSPTPVQGQTSYTVAADVVPGTVVQFRQSALDLELINLARQTYGRFVPVCEERGVLAHLYVYEMSLVSGVALSRFQHRLLAPQMRQQLLHTVQDLARFFASAWINKPLLRHTLQDTQKLSDHYESILNQLSQSLPVRFQQKLSEIRQSLPLLFRSDYVMTVNHDDLLEMNIHVDEETGRITGIVDWADAKIAPFGTSLWGLETVLGIQTSSSWLFHPDHVYFRQRFWETFYDATGHLSDTDRLAIEVGRLLGLFRVYGFNCVPEREGAEPLTPGDSRLVYLEALCLRSARDA